MAKFIPVAPQAPVQAAVVGSSQLQQPSMLGLFHLLCQ